MALRSLGITCFTLLAALTLGAAVAQQKPATSSADSSSPTQDIPGSIVTPSPAPIVPTLTEMRAMTAEQLDQLGDQLRAAKDYLSAVDCYREAIRKHATAEYYNKVAISNLLLHRAREAEKAAKQALRKNKHLAEAWNNLAVTYYMRNQLEAAIRTYERAISLRPDSASFHNNLAAALMDANQAERAISEYRKAFQLDPSFFERAARNGVSAHLGTPQDRAQFSFVMARLFAASGDLDRTLHFLRSAIEDGYPKIDDVYRDKEFAQVVKDERFLAMMKDRPVAVR